jgi:hypothetical protein
MEDFVCSVESTEQEILYLFTHIDLESSQESFGTLKIFYGNTQLSLYQTPSKP